MPFRQMAVTVQSMWIVLLAAFLLVAACMILNARARARLECLGGKPDDPTRRFWWMRSGG
jgi:hypothetical protein